MDGPIHTFTHANTYTHSHACMHTHEATGQSEMKTSSHN